MALTDRPGVSLTQLLGIPDPATFDARHAWRRPREARDRLRVPIGVDPGGNAVELDLKEAAQGGMGPHGLVVGAGGSGKSELLRTLVFALATTHGPETVNFVFVDFMGSATFAPLDLLPHTSATITSFADDLSLVGRLVTAIDGELVRRQELLRRAGNHVSDYEYERARGSGAPLAPLPSLLVIVDEFSELLAVRPDIIDLFIRIGRLGRSLGVHLLLASQRLEEGRLRGLDTHLSYRIGLRTFSTVESRAVLGVPDAYQLPPVPGHGFLRADPGQLRRFTAGYVSGAHHPPSEQPCVRGDDPRPPYPWDDDRPSVLDVLTGRMRGQGRRAHPVWLPPLDVPPTLGDLLGPLTVSPRRGLGIREPDPPRALHGLVGIVDRPFEQRRDPLWLDLSGAGGNVLVAGGPRSGKTTFLRTLIASLAARHTPREVQFYCLDFGGGGLSALAGLPHLGAVATRHDVGTARRTIIETHALLESRAALADDPYGEVFLVIDGWAAARDELEDLDLLILDLARRGLRHGIHLVATTDRWEGVRPALRESFGTRVELRLPDPRDSAVGHRAAATVPFAPGRGLTPDGLHFLTALPRFDGLTRVDDLTRAVTEFAGNSRAAWQGSPAPAIRALPAELPHAALPAPRGGRLPIGIAETDLGPAHLDFDTDPHALLFGDAGSGKSSFLRGLATMVTRAHPPTEARIILVDHRRSLLGCVDTEHLIGYGTTSQITTDMVRQVSAAMRERLPGPDVTPEQRRDRSWWTGPELYLLVDDHDLVADGDDLFAPLLDYLPHGRDIGLHVVVTRRTAGARRALQDPFINRIRELASPGILMSGSREEGALFGGVRPQPLPPGRAWLVTRRDGPRMLQLAWTPPRA